MSSSLNEMLQLGKQEAYAHAHLDHVVQADDELTKLLALTEGPANKKQRLEVPATGNDPMAVDNKDTPLGEAEAELKEVKAVLEEVITLVCKMKSNRGNCYARQVAARQAAVERQAAEAERVQAEAARQAADLFKELCNRVWLAVFGVSQADCHSVLEPRYYENGTWDVAALQSDLALINKDFAAKVQPVVLAFIHARQAAEAEAEAKAEAERKAAKEGWLHFDGPFHQTFEVVAPKSMGTNWAPDKRAKHKQYQAYPWTSELLEKMWEAGLPKAETCGVKGANGTKQTSELKKYLVAKGFKFQWTGGKDYWHCFALKVVPEQA